MSSSEGPSICPACGAENTEEARLGALGNLIHYRCRYCGAEFHVTKKPKPRRPRK